MEIFDNSFAKEKPWMIPGFCMFELNMDYSGKG
jgi:hypothetical protein